MYFGDIIYDLSNTDHHADESDSESCDYISKNHLEGDVWTHTCLVFRKFIDLMENKKSITWRDVYTCIAILCHDLGKRDTRAENDKGKITFYSHPFASIQYAIDFINYMRDTLGENPYYYILNPISNHIDFLRSTFGKHQLYCNHDPNLGYINSVLCYCDGKGRITEDEDTNKLSNIKFTFNNRNGFHDNRSKSSDVEIIFLCGVPGCGKNWFITHYYPNTPTISYDDIRLNVYRGEFGDTGESKKDEYLSAFKYCSRNKIDLNSHVNKRFKYLVNQGYKRIIINNTNLTKKRRRSLINLLGNKNYLKAIYIVRTTDEIVNANRTRDDKRLDSTTLFNFINKQPIPTKEEGFDMIEFFDNCKRG